MIEAKVQGFINEAEADNSPTHSVGELSAAQHRINAASCHGKDKIPNAALKAEVQAWQLVLLALLNAILLLSEYPVAWRYVFFAPLFKNGKGRSRRSMGDHRPIGFISTVANCSNKSCCHP